MESYLSIFVRDELSAWQKMTTISPQEFHDKVNQNVQIIVSRAEELSCRKEREAASGEVLTPVTQPLLDLISAATNPQK
jgi:phosphatidylinositol kinase/protein kinase (PI-3  family)